MSLYATGVRPVIDEYLKKKAEEKRNYGEYWSASSAGYCLRKNIFERLKVPFVEKDSDERKQRIFEVGHTFHRWYQDITREAGVSIAQELELQDEELKIRGHIDDLVLIDGKLILYDAKTAHSRSFTYSKGRPMSHYHKMQLGTYMYMLRKKDPIVAPSKSLKEKIYNEQFPVDVSQVVEGRILTMDKDALRMDEKQLLWSLELENEIREYWLDLNKAWLDYRETGELPPCTCADHEGGFMSREAYNPFFKYGQPCSEQYFKEWLAKEEADA